MSKAAAGPWRVVELSTVTDEELARVVNEEAAQGWSLQRIDYIKEAGVRRPQMAFLFFLNSQEAPRES